MINPPEVVLVQRPKRVVGFGMDLGSVNGPGRMAQVGVMPNWREPLGVKLISRMHWQAEVKRLKLEAGVVAGVKKELGIG